MFKTSLGKLGIGVVALSTIAVAHAEHGLISKLKPAAIGVEGLAIGGHGSSFKEASFFHPGHLKNLGATFDSHLIAERGALKLRLSPSLSLLSGPLKTETSKLQDNSVGGKGKEQAQEQGQAQAQAQAQAPEQTPAPEQTQASEQEQTQTQAQEQGQAQTQAQTQAPEQVQEQKQAAEKRNVPISGALAEVMAATVSYDITHALQGVVKISGGAIIPPNGMYKESYGVVSTTIGALYKWLPNWSINLSGKYVHALNENIHNVSGLSIGVKYHT